MVKNVLIVNPKELEEKVKDFLDKGKSKIHVLADFDKTLTYALMGRKKEYPSVISILRNGDYLTEDYARRAYELFDKYHPIEIDPHVPEKEKKEKMKEWWIKHLDLLIASGLNIKDLEAVVKSGIIKLRQGTTGLLKFLYKCNIPLVIMSSNGVGDTIKMFLERKRLMFPNVYIITNSFEYDKDGNAKKSKLPIIHAMNKTEVSVKHYPVFSKVKDKTNVILLGDGLGDIGMVSGFDYSHLIKIGFLNENVEENLPKFKEAYDVIILNDDSMDYVDRLVRKVCK